jgi:hypothetical protein
VFGLNQGVFRVRVDRQTGQRLVIPPLMASGSGDAVQPLRRGAIDRKPLPLEAFGARVREAMVATPKGQR